MRLLFVVGLAVLSTQTYAGTPGATDFAFPNLAILGQLASTNVALVQPLSTSATIQPYEIKAELDRGSYFQLTMGYKSMDASQKDVRDAVSKWLQRAPSETEVRTNTMQRATWTVDGTSVEMQQHGFFVAIIVTKLGGRGQSWLSPLSKGTNSPQNKVLEDTSRKLADPQH